MNHKPEDILALIRDIRPHLKKWLGSDAQVVEAKLAQFLQQHLDEKSAPSKKYAVSRGEGFSEIPGKRFQTPSGIKIYICPFEGCNYRWYQQRIGETPPSCFDHNVQLIEEKS